MESITFTFFVPVIAVILDSIIGDPKSWPHPVRYIGKFLDMYEASARKVGIDLRAAGWIAVLLFTGAVWGGAELLMAIPYLGVLIAIYLGYAGLAMGCLLKDARRVVSLLDIRDLPGARHALSMLVSRDTSELDANGIRQTLAETVSENLNDGFVTPLFYLALLGPGGMWAYKTVSTMDSMWGYKTKEYKDLGRGAAKTDDVLAYIPARMTAKVMIFVGKRLGLAHEVAADRFKADARKMESPNAGWPMAAAAWLVEGQMGGPTVYFGEVKDKPVLGPEGNGWDKQKIKTLLKLCSSTGTWAAWLLIPALGILQILF